MATNTEVNVRINVDAKGADTSVGSIKKQLKDATNELVAMREKFGDSSAEAVTAAKKVAELKDAIGDAKAMTDAFDPDAKFKAFGATLQGVAGGFAAVQGAQALFGSESEAVSRTLAKVQGAMALSQGINSVLQAKDAFKNLGAVLSNNVIIQKALQFVMTGTLKSQQQLTVAKESDVAVTATQATVTTGLTLAQNAARIAAIALRGALLATGVGALLVLLGSLFSAISNWVSGEEESKAAIDATNKALEAQQEAYKRTSDEIKFQGEIKKKQLEIAGASEADKFKTQQEYDKKGIEAAKANYEKLSKAADDYYHSLGDTVSKEEQAQIDKGYEAKHAAYDNLLQLQRDYTRSTLEEQKRLADLSRAADSELLNIKQANYLASIKDDDTRNREKSKIDLENAKKSLHEKGYSLEQEAAIAKELETKSNLELQAIDDAAAAKAQQKRDQNYKEAKAKRDARAKEIADATKALNEKIASLENEVYLMSIENEDKRAKEKLRIQYEAGIKEIEQSKAKEETKNKAEIALKAKYDADVKAIDEKKKADDEAKALEQRQKSIDFENETFNMLEEARIARIQDATIKAQEEEAKRYQADIDAALQALNQKQIGDDEYKARREAIETIHQGKLTDIAKSAEEERKRIEDEAHQKKINQYKEVADAAGALSEAIGKQTAVGKGLGVAQATINTYIGASEVLRAKTTIPEPYGTVVKIANVAAIIASGLKSVKAIIGTKVPGNAGGGGGNLSTPSGGGTIAPIAPTLNTTMLNQGQINQLSSATARAYVVESDVTGSQERIQRLNRAARIN